MNGADDVTVWLTQFRELVRSPLRAELLRRLLATPGEPAALDALSADAARLPLDVERCLDALTAFGIVRRDDEAPPRYVAVLPDDQALAAAVRHFCDADPPPHARIEDGPAARRFRGLIARDEAMLVALEAIRAAAKSDITVLITGPTGSGKSAAAHMIHEIGRRGAGPMQTVECGAIPDTLFESALFGHERGAFTGAHERAIGRVELAHGGTLFLDEIGDLSPASQARLLNVLQERRIERLGGRGAIPVDFRLISSTNQPIDDLLRTGRLREDLYFRLHAFQIRLPALRERASDIPVLAQRFLDQRCLDAGMAPGARVFGRDAMARLTGYSWPGNLRELDAMAARVVIASSARVVTPADLGDLSETAAEARRPRTLREVEQTHILNVLQHVRWNKREAARLLNVSRGTLYRKIDEYHLVDARPSRAARHH